MKAALAGHTLSMSQLPSNLNLHCLYLVENTAKLLQHIADCTQIRGTDFGSNLVNLLSPLCRMPSCRNAYGATRVPAAPVCSPQTLCGFIAQPKQSRVLFLLQPWRCFSCSRCSHITSTGASAAQQSCCPTCNALECAHRKGTAMKLCLLCLEGS